MRLIFAGTPAVALPSLDLLAAGPHEVALVITRPDAPRGRRRVLTPSPVAARADELGLPVHRTARLDERATERVQAAQADLGVVVAYGGLVREPLLSMPRHGWINLHFSLLPRWRGAAPVQHALLAGDERTGVSVFGLVPELDAGALYATRAQPIPADATAAELLAGLAETGAPVLAEVIAGIAAGRAHAEPQRGEATLAPKLTTEDGHLDFTEPTERVYARLRAVTPEPGAFTEVAGTRVKILRARRGTAHPGPGVLVRGRSDVQLGTADGALAVLEVQPAGKRAMAAADWGRGLPADARVTR